MKPRKFILAPYPFVPLLIALACGIVLQQKLQDMAGVAWLGACCITATLALWFHTRKTLRQWIYNARMAALSVSFLLLGAALAYYHDVRHQPGWYGHSLAQASFLAVQINEAPVEKTGTFLLPATVKAMDVSDQWKPATGDIKIYVYKKDFPVGLKAGQRLLIPNKLTPIVSSGNPFAFDAAAYAHHNGIYHQCFLAGSQLMLLPGKEQKPGLVLMLKQHIRSAIVRNVKDSVTAGLINAMLINDRTNLDAELQDAYSGTGIIHILAISGMHVILLAAILLFILGKIPLRMFQKGQHIIALAVIWLYIAITGFPPSANRAAVTFTIYTLGILLNRESPAVNTWASSGLLLIAYNPDWLYDVGFQLSFLAVLSLLLFNKTVTGWWQPRSYFLRKLWETIAISISVQILVFPLVIYYFNQFPLMVFLANIPAGIYSTLLMIGAMLICIADAACIPCSLLGQFLATVTHAFNALIVVLSHYAPACLKVLFLDAYSYWLLMAAIVALCIYWYYRSYRILLCGLSTAIVWIAWLTVREVRTLRQERVVVYNLSKESQVDVFKGSSVFHLYRPNERQYKYALKPARLGLGIDCDTASDLTCWKIGDRRVLVLKEALHFEEGSFPVDILIVSDRCRFEPENWMRVFHPSTIVLDSSVPRWKAEQWKTRLAGNNVAVYYSGERAWCYPSL